MRLHAFAFTALLVLASLVAEAQGRVNRLISIL
jgi:hypothetical protein